MDYPQYIPQIHAIAKTRLRELNIIASPVVLGKKRHSHDDSKNKEAKSATADMVWMKTFFSPGNVGGFPLHQLQYASEQLSHCLANVTAAIDVIGKGATTPPLESPFEPTHKEAL